NGLYEDAFIDDYINQLDPSNRLDHLRQGLKEGLAELERQVQEHLVEQAMGAAVGPALGAASFVARKGVAKIAFQRLRKKSARAAGMRSTGRLTGTAGSNAAEEMARREAAAVAASSVLARGTTARELLARNLGMHSFPVDAQAHHLFGVLFDTQLGKKLQGWGIDLNGAANGVYLPKYDYAGRVASLHRGRTAAAYTDEVVKRLGRARSGNDAIAILNKIRDDLLNGRLKINGAE
ncbi:MAG: AHH domain-containing protein, partial [Planctomycetaceae bacterium]